MRYGSAVPVRGMNPSSPPPRIMPGDISARAWIGEEVSARGIKAQIQKLVADENPGKPLTDQAIVNILKKEGIQIARRTVAKYRDQLGILSARMRKRV